MITATLRKLDILAWCSGGAILPGGQKEEKMPSSHLGVEPRTFGLEVQRAIHCANGTSDTHWLLKMVLFRNAEKMSEALCKDWKS